LSQTITWDYGLALIGLHRSGSHGEVVFGIYLLIIFCCRLWWWDQLAAASSERTMYSYTVRP